MSITTEHALRELSELNNHGTVLHRRYTIRDVLHEARQWLEFADEGVRQQDYNKASACIAVVKKLLEK